jgi:pyrroline-5-carboxylate reductase
MAKYGQPIIVYDRNHDKLRTVEKHYGVHTETVLSRAVTQAGLLIIAVQPRSISDLLQEIGKVDRPLIAVSLAAGIPLSRLRAQLRKPVSWARAMPSPACRGGRGLTALAFERGFPVAARQAVRSLFARVGPVLEIPETQFDSFTVTYSCSHGYHAVATLAAAAENLGLDRKNALTAAAHALADGILAWREGQTSLQALLQESNPPGGIAAGVIESMNRAGYKRAIAQGLAEGMKRLRRNARLVSQS